MADFKSHWETVHDTKCPDEVSWYETFPAHSLELIEATGCGPSARVIDVGGGISPLVDHLLDRGFQNPTVLDLSASALTVAQKRLGERRHLVRWLVCEVAEAPLETPFDIWHERAVLHFLTDPTQRDRHVAKLKNSLNPGGHAIIATFAEDGPLQCSGLDVVRYSPASLANALGDEFRLRQARRVTHLTPWDTEQKFVYCLFQKESG